MNDDAILSFSEADVVNTELSGFILEIAERLVGKIYLLVYKHHEIQIGIIENREIRIERKEELTRDYLKELRVFSINGEFYIWKQKQELKYRLRIDDEGDKTEKIYEEDHFMWGNSLENDRNTIYEQNQGMELNLPFEVSCDQLPLKYRVRNYYDYDKNGLIQFKDARLVCFLDKDGEEI